MSTICPVAKLFKEPTNWPRLPPWWLVTTGEAAGLLNITHSAMSRWRARGFGPPVVPPMYFMPVRGNPLWHQYGALRCWAAEKLGMTYAFEDQCRDFFAFACPLLVDGKGSIEARITTFKSLLTEDSSRLLTGQTPIYIPAALVHDLDPWRARQPQRRKL